MIFECRFKPFFIRLDDTKKAAFSGCFFSVARLSIFERFVLCKSPKSGRFVSESAKIWICGL